MDTLHKTKHEFCVVASVSLIGVQMIACLSMTCQITPIIIVARGAV